MNFTFDIQSIISLLFAIVLLVILFLILKRLGLIYKSISKIIGYFRVNASETGQTQTFKCPECQYKYECTPAQWQLYDKCINCRKNIH